MVRNISKRKKYENELIESREQAERASKLKSVFLANMSHEIRTPMNAIIGFSNFIMEEELDEATKQELKAEIRSNSDYLLSTINDIMEIAQIESGNRKVQFSENRMSTLLENIYQEQSRKCPADIHLSIQQNLPSDLVINTDANLIKQLFDRLIGNAVKFTGRGAVEMGCVWYASKKQAEFYVKDNGIGIQAQHLDEIFEPFHQLNSMMKGVGIGLTICRAHAGLLKTKIQVQSEPGKGSTFSFKLKAEG